MKYTKLVCLFTATYISILNVDAQIGKPYTNSRESIREGTTLHDQGSFKEAISKYNEVLDGDTLYYLALFEKALSQQGDSAFADAIITLDLLLEIPSSVHQQALSLKAACLDHLDEYEKSKEIYGQIISKYPYSNTGYFERAVLESNNKHYDECLQDLIKSIELNPFHPASHASLGIYAAEANQPALAIMATFFGLMVLEDNPDYALRLMQNIELVGTDNYKPSLENFTPEIYDFANELQDINEVVLSKTALAAKYKSKIKGNYTYAKQMQVICELLAGREAGNHPILQLYIPFFQEIWKTNHFAGMVVQPLEQFNSAETKKLAATNKKKIIAFVEKAGQELAEINDHVEFTENGISNEKTFLFNYGKVAGIGQKDASEKYTGHWKFYHHNGELSAEGDYKNGLKDGVWKYYSERGIISNEETISNGVLNGTHKAFSPSGVLKEVYQQKGEVTDGPVELYYEHGDLQAKFELKNGKPSGLGTNYDDHGFKTDETNFSETAGPTYFKSFNKDGSVSWESDLSSKSTGQKVQIMNELKQLVGEGELIKAVRNGPWKYYHSNGNLKEEGSLDNGTLTGEWKYYDWDGKLYQTSNFKNGTLDGPQNQYDSDGKLLSTVTYRNGKGLNYSFYDKEGKVLYEAKSTGGKLSVTTCNELRIKASEGMVNREEREGQWKFYHLNGALESEVNYENDLMEGKAITYHTSGKISSEMNYVKGVRQGFYKKYNELGICIEDGYFLDDQLHGPLNEYYADGNIETTTSFWNGKLNGHKTEFTPTGAKTHRYYYENDVLMELVSYDKDQKAIHVCQLQAGNGILQQLHIDGSPKFKVEMENSHFTKESIGTSPSGQADSKLQWRRGYRHGVSSFYENGVLISEGEYYDGVQIGNWKYFTDEGILKRDMNFVEGDLHGDYKVFHDNGKVFHDRQYTFEEKNGEISIYGEDGTLMIALNYFHGVLLSYTYNGKDGKLVAPIKVINDSGKVTGYYSSGKKSIEFELLYGHFHGDYTTWHSNGKLHEEWHYDHFLAQGVTKRYYSSGQVKEATEYLNDQEHGKRTLYHENGKIKTEENFLSGTKHGEAKYFDKNGKLIKKGEYYNGDFFES